MNRPSSTNVNQQNALQAWEEFMEEQVYPMPGTKAKEDYRNYDNPARETVREFYRQNHQAQTFDFVNEKRDTYLQLNHRRMSIFEALDYLNTLVDDSDPDIELDQLQHLLQTSEAIRVDGRQDWFVVTGLLHDLGKVLCLYGEPQWAVVGDTFPVGCRFDERIIYHEFFDQNPDFRDSRYSSRLGIYEEKCGLRNVKLSWGHDEYLYHIFKDYLPEPALYIIRYHSFYAWHREGAYDYLCDDHDREMLHYVQEFNRYDLYSKSPRPPDWNELRPHYSELINKYFPTELSF
jgi:inositol oxygenase